MPYIPVLYPKGDEGLLSNAQVGGVEYASPDDAARALDEDLAKAEQSGLGSALQGYVVEVDHDGNIVDLGGRQENPKKSKSKGSEKIDTDGDGVPDTERRFAEKAWGLRGQDLDEYMALRGLIRHSKLERKEAKKALDEAKPPPKKPEPTPKEKQEKFEKKLDREARKQWEEVIRKAPTVRSLTQESGIRVQQRAIEELKEEKGKEADFKPDEMEAKVKEIGEDLYRAQETVHKAVIKLGTKEAAKKIKNLAKGSPKWEAQEMVRLVKEIEEDCPVCPSPHPMYEIAPTPRRKEHEKPYEEMEIKPEVGKKKIPKAPRTLVNKTAWAVSKDLPESLHESLVKDGGIGSREDVSYVQTVVGMYEAGEYEDDTERWLAITELLKAIPEKDSTTKKLGDFLDAGKEPKKGKVIDFPKKETPDQPEKVKPKTSKKPDLVTLAYYGTNKHDNLEEYLSEAQRPDARRHETQAEVAHTKRLTTRQYNDLANNLLKDRKSWFGVKFKGGSGTTADLPDVDKWTDYTEDQKEAYRKGAYSRVIKLIPPQKSQPTLYVDPQGYQYARYVWFDPKYIDGVRKRAQVAEGQTKPKEEKSRKYKPIDLNDAIKRIRKALKTMSGKTWSVRRGKGTVYSWIHVFAPPKRVTKHKMSEEDARDLAKMFGEEIKTDAHLSNVRRNDQLISPDEREYVVHDLEKRAKTLDLRKGKKAEPKKDEGDQRNKVRDKLFAGMEEAQQLMDRDVLTYTQKTDLKKSVPSYEWVDGNRTLKQLERKHRVLEKKLAKYQKSAARKTPRQKLPKQTWILLDPEGNEVTRRDKLPSDEVIRWAVAYNKRRTFTQPPIVEITDEEGNPLSGFLPEKKARALKRQWRQAQTTGVAKEPKKTKPKPKKEKPMTVEQVINADPYGAKLHDKIKGVVRKIVAKYQKDNPSASIQTAVKAALTKAKAAEKRAKAKMS